MDTKQLAAEVGCTEDIAAECIAKRPGNPVAARALAVLKSRATVIAQEIPPATECAKGHPPAKMAGNLCPVCTARAARKTWAEE